MRFKDKWKRRFFSYFDCEGRELHRHGLYGGGGKGGGGGGSSAPAQTTTVQKSDPWAGQQPYLTSGFSRVSDTFLDGTPPAFYPGSTVTPFSPETNLAMSLQAQRALNGSPIQSAGTQQLSDTLSGKYLNDIPDLFYNNPYQKEINDNLISPSLRGDYLFGGQGFNEAYDAAARKIIPQVDSAFERAGRTGSGLAQQAKTQALSDSFAGLYNQERDRQFNAGNLGNQINQSMNDLKSNERENIMRSMMFAPQMASLDYQDFAKLAEVGSQKEALSQQELADKIARYDYDQNAKRNSLIQYMNLIQGNYGGNSTSTSNATLQNTGGGYSPNIIGGIGGMLMAPSLGISPAMGLLGGLK